MRSTAFGKNTFYNKPCFFVKKNNFWKNTIYKITCFCKNKQIWEKYNLQKNMFS